MTPIIARKMVHSRRVQKGRCSPVIIRRAEIGLHGAPRGIASRAGSGLHAVILQDAEISLEKPYLLQAEPMEKDRMQA